MAQPQNRLKPIALTLVVGLSICAPKAAFAQNAPRTQGNTNTNTNTTTVVVVQGPLQPCPQPQQPTRPVDPAFVF